MLLPTLDPESVSSTQGLPGTEPSWPVAFPREPVLVSMVVAWPLADHGFMFSGLGSVGFHFCQLCPWAMPGNTFPSHSHTCVLCWARLATPCGNVVAPRVLISETEFITSHLPPRWLSGGSHTRVTVVRGVSLYAQALSVKPLCSDLCATPSSPHPVPAQLSPPQRSAR